MKAKERQERIESLESNRKERLQNYIQEKAQYDFGFVASNINQNFIVWATLKGSGTDKEAEHFYQKNYKHATLQGLEWFQIEFQTGYSESVDYARKALSE